MYQVLQEGLTNAAKYAPHSEVEVCFDAQVSALQLRISNSVCGEPPSPRPGTTGLVTLRKNLEVAGGSLQIFRSTQRFELLSTIPLANSAVPQDRGYPALKPTARWLLITVPLLVVAVVASGLYFLQDAMYRATALSPTDFQKLELGMSRQDVAELVSATGLDSALPVIQESAPPSGAQFRFFAAKTGVLDLGSEMFRLCFRHDLLVSADHLYPTP